MSPPSSLKRVIDFDAVRLIADARPDELAPQLSLVVRGLLEDEPGHMATRGIGFVRSTVLTKAQRGILEEVFASLRNGAPFTTWLNLDAGSGKTHLLVLLTYLIHGYRYLKEELGGFESLGLSEGLAMETALFVADLRTPSEVPTTFLPFFAASLRRVGEWGAADYVESCAKRDEMPEASEVVRRLGRGGTKVVAMIDELHHAVLTYRGSKNERRWVRDVMEFATSLINYLRHYGRGFAVIVASAKSDYGKLGRLPGGDELAALADNLVSQLGRLKRAQEAGWVSVEEAKRIILKKLGARQDVLHSAFDGFIERVIRAESDIPQAHHLRSLIKAMAVYTANAVDMGHGIVTPLAFSERVIDALFPEGGAVADEYKSAYSHARRVVEGLRGVEGAEKDVALLIVNAIFAASITGRADLLIEAIRAYKKGGRPGTLPAITEREIVGLLHTVGIQDPARIGGALDIVSGVEYVHSVKRGDTYVYFAVPMVSIVAAYSRDIDERYRSMRADRGDLVSRFVSYLRTLAGRTGKSFQVVVVGSFEELERATRGLSPDTMYLVVYADPELIKCLEERVRANPGIDIAAEISGWMRAKTGRDIPEWLEGRRRFNVAVTVPVPLDEALEGVARYYAVEGATHKVITEYLLESARAGGRLRDEMRELIEVELDEINRALSDRLTEALSLFAGAYSKALCRAVYVYECRYELSGGVACRGTPKSLDPVGLGEGRIKRPVAVGASEGEYARLIDALRTRRDELVGDLLEVIVERIKRLANFVDDADLARELILQEALRGLGDSGEYRLSTDMNTFVSGSRVLYLPPSVVSGVAKTISAGELERMLKELTKAAGVRVIMREEGGALVLEAVRRPAATPEGTAKPTRPPEGGREADRVAEAIKALDSCERGEVRMVLGFDESAKSSIKTYLSALRRYIKELEVRPSRACGT